MHGRWFSSATSCARRCFLTVRGKYVPPLTVASLATITHARPSTIPIPATPPGRAAWPRTPPAGAQAGERVEPQGPRAAGGEPVDPLAGGKLPTRAVPLDGFLA